MSDRIKMSPQEAAFQLLEGAHVPPREIADTLRIPHDELAQVRADPAAMSPMQTGCLALLLFANAARTDPAPFAYQVARHLVYVALGLAIDRSLSEAALANDERESLAARLRLELLGPDYLDREGPPAGSGGHPFGD